MVYLLYIKYGLSTNNKIWFTNYNLRLFITKKCFSCYREYKNKIRKEGYNVYET